MADTHGRSEMSSVILPVAPDHPRPFWSVMIPAYNPSPCYLGEALRSVLAQDPGPEQMQIEVVDDCSSEVSVARMVHEIAGNRVTVSQTARNLGLAGCWNTCIKRAGGEWVHILHQDDWVLPGFYESLKALVEVHPTAGAAFTRFSVNHMDGKTVWIAERERDTPGVLDLWLEALLKSVRIQCPAIVVKRSTYENLGGFRTDFPHILDYEMWLRVAAAYPMLYHPEILAVFRYHGESTTSRHKKSGENARDYLRLARLLKDTPFPFPRTRHFQTTAAEVAWDQMRIFMTQHEWRAAWSNALVWLQSFPVNHIQNKLAGRFTRNWGISSASAH